MAGPRTIGQVVSGRMKSDQFSVPCSGYRVAQAISNAIDRGTIGMTKAASIPGTPAHIQAKNKR